MVAKPGETGYMLSDKRLIDEPFDLGLVLPTTGDDKVCIRDCLENLREGLNDMMDAFALTDSSGEHEDELVGQMREMSGGQGITADMFGIKAVHGDDRDGVPRQPAMDIRAGVIAAHESVGQHQVQT